MYVRYHFNVCLVISVIKRNTINIQFNSIHIFNTWFAFGNGLGCLIKLAPKVELEPHARLCKMSKRASCLPAVCVCLLALCPISVRQCLGWLWLAGDKDKELCGLCISCCGLCLDGNCNIR
jgi:hypothetical protein